jgi:putative membrane protein
MMNGLGGMMGGMGGLGTIFVLFWISLLAVVIWAMARIFPSRAAATPQSPAGDDPAVEALRIRFGRGEINAEEFLCTLEVLESGPSAPSKELPVR